MLEWRPYALHMERGYHEGRPVAVVNTGPRPVWALLHDDRGGKARDGAAAKRAARRGWERFAKGMAA